MPFDNIIQALQETQRGLPDMVLEQAMNHQDQIVVFNQGQLQLGLRSDGTTISPAYKPVTMRLKRTSNPNPNLKDKGGFYGKMHVIFDFANNEFIVSSSDFKTLGLKVKYGDNIFGLTDDSIQKLIDLIRPDLQDAVRKRILK